jgi:DNA-binding MarR family transcriptional regulator
MPSHLSSEALPGTLGLEDLSFYLGRAYHHYCLVLEDSLRANGVGGHIRPGMGPVIFALFESSNLTLRELGEASDLSPSTVTELVQKLEKAGVLARKPCDLDGRASRITLTAKGCALRERLEAVSRDVNGLLESGLSKHDVARLKHNLATMIKAMRARRAEARIQTAAPSKSGKPSRARSR